MLHYLLGNSLYACLRHETLRTCCKIIASLWLPARGKQILKILGLQTHDSGHKPAVDTILTSQALDHPQSTPQDHGSAHLLQEAQLPETSVCGSLGPASKVAFLDLALP